MQRWLQSEYLEDVIIATEGFRIRILRSRQLCGRFFFSVNSCPSSSHLLRIRTAFLGSGNRCQFRLGLILHGCYFRCCFFSRFSFFEFGTPTVHYSGTGFFFFSLSFFLSLLGGTVGSL